MKVSVQSLSQASTSLALWLSVMSPLNITKCGRTFCTSRLPCWRTLRLVRESPPAMKVMGSLPAGAVRNRWGSLQPLLSQARK
ncbi:hypothetical protein N8I74_08345 [Chitiniphilus purpureus]|uniref:Secreted protein n=1 Tax=Chitiniphilus purpureus TaxID=2981137 RepID=A0ABY6DRK5_9NEIS|nr:hypothetical protein [Chitiniphilus sp. CD1]UXY17005.1 hypothetical protein N8I74_08345 [Chitiniphilus sp. CD1]